MFLLPSGLNRGRRQNLRVGNCKILQTFANLGNSRLTNISQVWQHLASCGKESPVYRYSSNDILITLRIDNRRQSVIRGILLSSLPISCTLTCYICNNRSYFSLSDHIIYKIIGLVSRKISILNHFYHFYVLNIDTSLTT